MDIVTKKSKLMKYEGRYGFYLVEGTRRRFVKPGEILEVKKPDRINHRGKKLFKPFKEN